MKNDFLILGLSIKDYLPYLFMLAVGFLVSWLFVLRTIKNENFSGVLDKVRYISWGVGSSMLTTWISFELINYISQAAYPFPLAGGWATSARRW
ncbi:holin [Helicobacter heilmannii]|uniref:holin n=1 Tax=Helicobacter heilmannii TaxID=35817 RepID=UPI002D79429E|nr:holin [Helicobacter heilmannii]